MFFSRTEIVSWVIAILIVVVMGIITFTGPYHKINKVAAAPTHPLVNIRILTNPSTIGTYSPATITVHVGQDVVFSNLSNADHTVTARNGAFNSGNISRNGSWTFIPKATGTFKYYCIYHPFMHGTLIVKP